MKIAIRSTLSAYCLMMLGLVAPVHAQFKLEQSFENTTAPGWTLSYSAILTAPSLDADGSGWLRLTDTGGSEKGLALNSGFSFAGNQPVVVRFNYVSWGGSGADGMTVFLYDSSTPSPMSGALTGGGLGYCGGAGGYLAIGLDEYGNFSNPSDHCTNGGPGRRSESLVIRGPMNSNDPWITTASVTGGIDNPHVGARPSPKTVQLTLTPAVSPGVGYTITAQFQSASGQPFQTLFSNTAFSYVPPTNISVGFSGSTGGSTNNHEIHLLAAATPDDVQLTLSGPATVLQGAVASYTLTVTNNGNFSLTAGDAPSIVDTLPASLSAVTWTCAGAGGGVCDASGSGNLNTTNVTIPPNGSVTYAIAGTLDPAATCGSTLANSANTDFPDSASFLDPDETNNTATVNSTVTCDTTLVASPAALTYPPQQVNTASATQSVTLTEGNNGTATLDSIAVSGDYSQTNDCAATLATAQTCTVNVTFTPGATGSRNGSLTIQSNLAGQPTMTSVVSLSGTGVDTIPDPFSFTPLVNVDPSSVQVSNAITVAGIDAPAPISVSAGGQYSINGGPFTSVAGVVSPGAQVRVQLTAAAGYSTSDSATLTVGGISSTFTVTTGAQPVIQGAFTPVTGAVPGSIQTSNAVTVTGITNPVSISVSVGDEYSINGGTFTSAPGTVHPGDQVTARLTAPPTTNTTASAIVTIGGVAKTYTVTTATQAIPQAQFTAVTGASVGSQQISNAVTITCVTAPAAISVSNGSEYSIDGGPYTATAGSVLPGDQVRVETTASADYDTTTTAVVTVGTTALDFPVTTGAKPVFQGSFTSVTGVANSSAQTSNPVTVTGITSPALISISSGAEYSINGGPFTSAPGTVKAGDVVRVLVTAPAVYQATATATLTIDGVALKYSVSTGQQPLTGVAVTGGGGAMGAAGLGLLALLTALKVARRRVVHPSMMALALVTALIFNAPVRADDGGWSSNLYGGIRIGASTSTMTAARLARDLQADGYQITAAGAERGTASGSLYLGYELRDHFAVEVAGAYVGRTRAALTGVLPSNLNALLADTAHIVRGSGDVVALEARYRWPLTAIADLDLRAGPYYWRTTSDVYVSGADRLNRADSGLGYTLGIGPRFALGRHLGLGVSAEYFNSTSESQFWLLSATLEYHFR